MRDDESLQLERQVRVDGGRGRDNVTVPSAADRRSHQRPSKFDSKAPNATSFLRVPTPSLSVRLSTTLPLWGLPFLHSATAHSRMSARAIGIEVRLLALARAGSPRHASNNTTGRHPAPSTSCATNAIWSSSPESLNALVVPHEPFISPVAP